ncbi:unnamed protein product [Lampetra planeri]
MGLRHTVGQRRAERGGAERLTGDCVRGAREEEITEERAGACVARERSVRGTREELALHARGACVARERSVRVRERSMRGTREERAGTREELALHVRGDAGPLSGPAGFEDEWRS